MLKPILSWAIASLQMLILSNSLFGQKSHKPAMYDFRESDEYRALDDLSRERLATVVADFDELEAALNAFMNDHDGDPPETLSNLVPKYMKALPRDPFANPRQAVPIWLKHHKRSLDGLGYLYLMRGKRETIESYDLLVFGTAPGAWEIVSVGLLGFPLRYEVSNRGLIRAQGYWGRYQLDIF